jgi:hypothetical protein
MALYETASYKVIKKISKHIELRKYPTFYMATTTVKLDNKYTNGFSEVFNYISGNNENNQKISMTTPVISTTNEDSLTTSFVIPSKFENQPPKPSNKNVTITEIKDGTFLIMKFSGKWTKSNFDKYDSILLEYIKSNNYSILSQRYILRYQPPFIPAFFRRNEIMYRVVEEAL